MTAMTDSNLDVISGEDLSIPSFQTSLEDRGLHALVREPVKTLQVNVGKVCNQACHHCHVEAGPNRTESMSRDTAERIVEILAASPHVECLDVTGGAPEINPHFRFLVSEGRRRGLRVIDRCNLTILLEPGQEDLARFLADQGVEIVASLPCYQKANVERQRGRGVFDKSIAGLRLLNGLGYGRADSQLVLNLVYNPGGASLPPAQSELEGAYRTELRSRFGIEFTQLLTLTNMPINRFADHLEQTGQLGAYMSLLVNHFNRATLDAVMCRSLLSIGYDGQLYDCDFNQMLELPAGGRRRTVWEIEDLEGFEGTAIAVGSHCYGCTAGSGSSCSGALT